MLQRLLPALNERPLRGFSDAMSWSAQKGGQIFDDLYTLDLEKMTWQTLRRSDFPRCCHTATYIPSGGSGT